VRIGLEVLLDRIQSIELDRSRPVELLPNLMTRGHKEVPLIVSRPQGRSLTGAADWRAP
jgi:hypothetical protein